jgi:hypothetical protein
MTASVGEAFGAAARRRDPRDREARIATLQVEVRASPGVSRYSLYVDGVPATMAGKHRGEVDCLGRSGDGSGHSLLYSFAGLAGSTLDITLHCASRIVCRIRAGPIAQGGPNWRAGREPFAI